jgi:hypothetical protein
MYRWRPDFTSDLTIPCRLGFLIGEMIVLFATIEDRDLDPEPALSSTKVTYGRRARGDGIRIAGSWDWLTGTS